jgi:transposase, IS30 family
MSGVAMGTRYSHFSLDERCRLRGLMEMGLKPSEIARRLSRHRGTVYREIARNRCVEEYRPDSADRMAWVRKLRGSKIQRSASLRDYVGDRLAMGWSPEQIAGRMELDTMEHAVSAETIYRYVYSPAGRHAGLARYLAQRKAKRGRRRRNGRREPPIPNRVSIHQRPAEARRRGTFGNWDGDLMHFRRQSDIVLTLQERCSRLTLAERLHSKDSADTATAIIGKLDALPSPALLTITYDNGGEFAQHERVRKQIGLRAFFCDPHSPWQRGGIENANGLIRRDLPRKASLRDYTDEDIDSIVWNLNSTPRKCLGFRTPIEAFANNLGVALES